MAVPVLRTLSNPTVEVNDVTVEIMPNSFSYKKGYGDRSVKTQSSGGNASSIVLSENAETKFSVVKFKMLNTAENLKAIDGYIEQSYIGNTINFSEGSIAEAFEQMVVITEPDRVLGADGNFEIEFNGKAAQ